MKKVLGLAAVAAVVLLIPNAGVALNDNVPIISQGDFATLYVFHARLDPEAAWTPESAIDALVDLGIEPLNGWEPEMDLTEGTMVQLLRFLDIPVFTAQSDRLVTVNEARAMFERFERLMIGKIPALLTLTGTTATTHAIHAVGHPIPERASP